MASARTVVALSSTVVLAVHASGCCGRGSETADPEPSPATSDGPACVRDDTGTSERRIEHDGATREYLVSVPEALDPTTAAPLVVELHGFSSDAQQQRVLSGMGDAAGRRGYAVVTPQALEVDVPLTTGTLRTTFWNIDPAAGPPASPLPRRWPARTSSARANRDVPSRCRPSTATRTR